MRPTIIAGNWKMHKTLGEGMELAKAIIHQLKEDDLEDKQVIFCPPFIHITSIASLAEGQAAIACGAQNCSSQDEGALTGEVSAAMIKSAGAEYVIIGHSERRAIFGETNQQLADKMTLAIKNGLKPIFCCGETLEQRNIDKQYEVVSRQIRESLFHLTANEMQQVIIAYEPVWAIGTGQTASPAEAQDMHQFIRHFLRAKYEDDIAGNICILYGGSLKPDNAASLLAKPDIDGGLIGGASLKVDDFLSIIKS
ncbi:MAG: triose-phosphate isomerase [Bacteroidia bacterium]